MTQIRTFISAVPGVDKTTTVLHLAVALVRMGQRVLCIDADPALGLFRVAGLSMPGDPGPVRVESTTLPGLSFLAPAPPPALTPVPPPGTPDPPLDWILIDTIGRLPPRWTLPPGARVVVCTDAETGAPEQVEQLLEDLLRLKNSFPSFTLDRLLLTRVDWASRDQFDLSRAWRLAVGPAGMWRTQIRQDRNHTMRCLLQKARISAPDSPLGDDSTRLALEWLQSPQSENTRFSHVDALL
jgi:cellulose biosynthesis protein BcsQ